MEQQPKPPTRSKMFTFERKISLDTILTLGGIFIGLAILYSRLVALELKVDWHEKHLDKLDTAIEKIATRMTP